MITFPAWVTGPTPCKTMTNKSVYPLSKYGMTKHGAIILYTTTYPYSVAALLEMPKERISPNAPR